jgi:hypothetical protein
LYDVKITVKLDEAFDPASKLQLGGFLGGRFSPSIVGGPQATAR